MSGRVLVDGRALILSRHAVQRYQDRVRPALDLDQVEAELRRILPLEGRFTAMPPEWVDSEDSDGWVLLGDDIAFVVQADHVFTCLTRAEPSEESRQRQNEGRAKRKERAGRKGTREKHGKVARAARAHRRQEMLG